MNRKIKRKERGMTLLEVLLALVLSSLFFLYTEQFLAIGATLFTKIKTQQELRFAMNQVIRTFEEQYEEAAHLCIYIGRPNESLKSLSGCEQGLHGQKLLEQEDYTQYFLYTIDYYMPEEMYQDHQQNGSEEVKTSIELREYVKLIDKNRQPYFHMIFQTQAVIPHDLTIEVDVKEEYLILKITLFKEEYYLEDQLRLDLRYKL